VSTFEEYQLQGRATAPKGEFLMYARVTTYEGKVDDFAWARAVFEAQVQEKVRRLVGCSGVLLMMDPDSGESLSITLWDDDRSMIESREDAAQIRSAAASFSGATVSDVAEYEVALAEIS
jgi:hypothetical protein